MIERSPLVDPRTAQDVSKQIKDLLQVYAPDWDQKDPMGNALIAVFSRYAEIIIERLNQVPEKNLLAFLDLLGTSPLPPQPARVPLTFKLAEGATVDVTVPAGTQVGGEPAADEQQPILFETEHELVVTAASLTVIGVREPSLDRYTQMLLSSGNPGDAFTREFSVFAGENPSEHIMYLGHRALFESPGPFEVKLDFTLTKNGNKTVVWEYSDGENWKSITPTADTTKGLTTSGSVNLTLSAALPEMVVNSVSARWLRCRLVLNQNKTTEKLDSNIKLPVIEKITLTATRTRTGLNLDAAAFDTLPIDIGQEFFPFGETPKLGDKFYFAHKETFSKAGAQVTLTVTVKDPKEYIQTDAGNQTIPSPRIKPTLVLEYWNGGLWKELAGMVDATDVLTQSKSLVFTVPPDLKASTITGIENYWIRMRISANDYGKPAGVKLKTDDKGQPKKDGNDFLYTWQPATLVPPLLSQLSLAYTSTAPENLETVLLYNDFHYEIVKPSTEITPFVLAVDDQSDSSTKPPTLYLGFSLPEGRDFPKLPLSLYFAIAVTEYNYTTLSDVPVSSDSPRLVWEYWNGEKWLTTIVQDETDSLKHSGLVIWLPPTDIQKRTDFGVDDHFWLRVRLADGAYLNMPQLQWLRLNTTMAAQTVTLTNEVLGSSNESQRQRFRATHAPVLSGQKLEVTEAEIPTASELAIIQQEEGSDAVHFGNDSINRRSVWVRWHEVPDFHGSGPNSRHYVIDRLNGEIRFGDGINGLVPPRGIGNIRLSWYQTGGGKAGNKPVGTVTQLQSTLPYIDSVINHAAASGGADAETTVSVKQNAPKRLRHRFRAVTAEDFEDLALQASFEVARSLCVPLLDVEKNPLLQLEEADKKAGTGKIGVIIVPRSAAPKPLPDQALLDRVRDYLNRHAIATADISVAGPLYLSLDVELEIVLTSPEVASTVQSDFYQRLVTYLHPLSGGLDGNGWPFGEQPQQSDIYRLASTISGIDHVQDLTLSLGTIEKLKDGEDTVDKIKQTGRYLIYSGNHTIKLKYQ